MAIYAIEMLGIGQFSAAVRIQRFKVWYPQNPVYTMGGTPNGIL